MQASDIKITAVLTGYNRPENLVLQRDALLNQTIPPEHIWLWYNKGDKEQKPIENVTNVICDANFKFHGRFALAQLAQTEYVAIFDDDSIPGKKWFENCVQCVLAQPGIYGTSGVILRGETYFPYLNAGWNASPQVTRDHIVEVDLVGHAWFMPKDFLKFLWIEDPVTWETAEDIQLSYSAQKYASIRTFCPPHPIDNKDLWGSTDGQRMGTDEVATSLDNQEQFHHQRNEVARAYINRGWKPMFMRGQQ